MESWQPFVLKYNIYLLYGYLNFVFTAFERLQSWHTVLLLDDRLLWVLLDIDRSF